VNLLVSQLKICEEPGEVEKRMFFVSAKEALYKRVPPRVSYSESNNVVARDKRYTEYVRFERMFEESISTNAMRVKFYQPTREGETMVRYLRSISYFEYRI